MPLNLPFPPDRGTKRDVEWGFHLPPSGYEPKSILDLGANIGLTVVDFVEKFPYAYPIVGVELDFDNYRVACENVQAYWNVIMHHAGVALMDGMCAYDKAPASNAFHIGHGEGRAPCITIDSLLRDYFSTGVDFMKVDIEGMEREIFKAQGAEWPEMVRCLSVETHYGYEPEEAVRDLAALGYGLVWIHSYGVPKPGMQEHCVVFAERR